MTELASQWVRVICCPVNFAQEIIQGQTAGLLEMQFRSGPE
jgi:hypothetical protein